MSSTTTIFSLPEEVIVCILSFLSFKEIGDLRLVSKTVKALCDAKLETAKTQCMRSLSQLEITLESKMPALDKETHRLSDPFFYIHHSKLLLHCVSNKFEVIPTKMLDHAQILISASRRLLTGDENSFDATCLIMNEQHSMISDADKILNHNFIVYPEMFSQIKEEKQKEEEEKHHQHSLEHFMCSTCRTNKRTIVKLVNKLEAQGKAIRQINREVTRMKYARMKKR